MTGGHRLAGLDDLLLEPDKVVDVLELAVLDVERVAAEPRTVREQDSPASSVSIFTSTAIV